MITKISVEVDAKVGVQYLTITSIHDEILYSTCIRNDYDARDLAEVFAKAALSLIKNTEFPTHSLVNTLEAACDCF